MLLVLTTVTLSSLEKKRENSDHSKYSPTYAIHSHSVRGDWILNCSRVIVAFLIRVAVIIL